MTKTKRQLGKHNKANIRNDFDGEYATKKEDILASELRNPTINNLGSSLADTADRHVCYAEAVQDVRREVQNLYNFYMDIRDSHTSPEEDVDYIHRTPQLLREDFCGTAILCQEWVSRHFMRSAIGIDLDSDVLAYAKDKVIHGATTDRVELICENVLSVTPAAHKIQKADILTALNYSLCYFHSFQTMVQYLETAKQGISDGGIMVCDTFNHASSPSHETNSLFIRECSNFTYYFEQSPVNFLTNTVHCRLHFKFNDGSWMKPAYAYHFRVWTVAEIRDAMLHAGFTGVDVWIFKSGDRESEIRRIRADEIIPNYPWNAYIIAYNSRKNDIK